MIRTFFSKADIKQLTEYNQYVEQVKKGVEWAQQKLTEFGSSMTSTAQAAAKAADGGVVALDKLGAKFNWAALKVQALNAAFSATIIGLISFAISGAITLIDNYIRRVEIAHEATAQKIAEYEKQKSSIASLNYSLDGNYGMYN